MKFVTLEGLSPKFCRELFITLVNNQKQLDHESINYLQEIGEIPENISNLRYPNFMTLEQTGLTIRKFEPKISINVSSLLSMFDTIDFDEYFEFKYQGKWLWYHNGKLHHEAQEVKVTPIKPILLVGWEETIARYVKIQSQENQSIWYKPYDEVYRALASWKSRENVFPQFRQGLNEMVLEEFSDDWTSWIGYTVFIDLSSILYQGYYSPIYSTNNAESYKEYLVNNLNAELEKEFNNRLIPSRKSMGLLLDELKLRKVEGLERIKKQAYKFNERTPESRAAYIQFLDRFGDGRVNDTSLQKIHLIIDLAKQVSNLGIQIVLTYTLDTHIIIHSPGNYEPKYSSHHDEYFLNILNQLMKGLEEKCLIPHPNSPFISYLQ